ncbi:LysR family transcriptional regulator [Mesorhizobium sp. M1406]|uniref:LysR family transcriptional regulator n=1 Tax=Mesorhizobium sp. M1406 TaxID=2957099 RepID=UPI003335409D
MPDLSLDFRLFRYAIASADHGSFRRAATALNIQQSTVSRGVRSLEYRLGAPLFERSHAGVRPTAAGKRFLQEAALGFDHLNRAMQRIGALQRGEHGEVTIAASVPFVLLGEVFERFNHERQGVSVEIVEGTCRESATRVQQREADIAFLTKAPADPAVQSLHLRDERVFVVLPTSHRLAKDETALMPEELRSEKFILAAGGLGPELASYLKKHMAQSGSEPTLQSHRIGQWDVINMVARGFGVTVMIGSLEPVAPEGVVLVPLSGRYTIPVHAAWLAENANPALWGLLGIVRRAASHRLQDGS